jgi:hypothetical protein
MSVQNDTPPRQERASMQKTKTVLVRIVEKRRKADVCWWIRRKDKRHKSGTWANQNQLPTSEEAQRADACQRGLVCVVRHPHVILPRLQPTLFLLQHLDGLLLHHEICLQSHDESAMLLAFVRLLGRRPHGRVGGRRGHDCRLP